MVPTGLLGDLRLALRALARRPGFTAVTVITLALGIGATTAVFTLVDRVLIRPLPFPASERLVSLQHLGRDGQDELPMSQGLYLLYREQARTLDDVALFNATNVNLVVQGEAQRIAAQAVTPGFFGVLGVQPTLGRTLTEEEGAPGGEQVVILSDAFWRSQFGGDPSVLGRTLDVNGQLRPIVGVMPPDFGFPDREARVWIPLVVNPAQAPLGAFGAGGVGRLAEGASVEGLQAELQGFIGRLSELFPDSPASAFLQEVGLRARVLPLKESLVGDIRPTLWILLGTVGFVLLIACANVANLLLVRAEGRQRELAVRAAMGASRAHMLRWFMSESLILAVASGVLGVVVAAAAVRASLAVVPTNIARLAEIGVDLRVGAFAGVVALGCALFFGLFPLTRQDLPGLAGQLREGSGRGATSGRERHRLRSGLVVVQMALALVLLVGSGLMFRSFSALRAVDPGFDVENVLTAQLTVPTAEIQDPLQTAGFFRQLGERLAAQQGVEAVGFAQSAPLTGIGSFGGIELEDHPRAPNELPIFANVNQVAPGYFESLGIRLVDGRTFRDGDGAEGARSAVVSRSFAERWWPNASALGRRVRVGMRDEDWYTVVGVVEDAHYESLEEAAREAVYWPLTVGPAASPFVARTVYVTVRTAADPLQFLPVLRREVRDMNARIPLSNPRTMADIFESATSRASFTMALLGAASGIALLLGLVGIYGVISYIVSQRTREIGVRMALGATAAAVRGMVVRQGVVLAAVGVGIGLVAAGALSSLMASLLFGVSPLDPVTYGAVAAALVCVAALASWLPAQRAARVQPAEALRAE